MEVDLQWLIGIAATSFLGWASILIAAFWRILAIIRNVEDQMKEGDENLHSRINRVREDTVHKADLDKHMQVISENFRELRREHQESSKATNGRLDALLNAIANQGKGH